MQLKSLEMQGFKSFADRTRFDFSTGITGIVGPNGCGKSNVVDAMKWVLGDMSAKSIRGDEMLDCIFNGAAGRQPSGFAEVSLTFDNADGKLASEFSEVTVTRRLYRSGESEYLINKQPARRKDILDIFMDTGVSTDAYSIIEQGRIHEVLDASPKDRRELLDEAAGISRYRARKKESIARLERVGQDLLRLGDVLKEMESNIRSLKIQAGKAERYVKLQAEWKDKRTLLALLSFDQLRAEAGRLAQALEHAEAERASVGERIAGIERDAEEAKRAEEEAAAAYHAAGGRREAAGRDVAACRSAIGDAEGMAASVAEQAAQAGEELERVKAQAKELRAREEEARAAFAAAEKELEGIAGELEARERARAEADAAARELDRKRAESEREAAGLLDKRAEHRNEAARVEANRANLEAQRVRIAEKAERQRGEGAEVGSKLEGAGAVCASLDQVVAKLKADYAGAEQGLAAAKTASQDAARALSDGRTAHAKTEAKLNTLRDIERQMEGVSAGAKKFVEAARKGNAPPGFRGLVADLLEFDPATALAAEAILGDRAQAAVFDTTEQVKAAIVAGGGRVALIALDRMRGGPIPRVADALALVGADFEPSSCLGPLPVGTLVHEALAEILDADFEPGSFGFIAQEETVGDDFFAAFAVPTGPELVEQIFPDRPPSGRLADLARCAPELRALAEALCGNAIVAASRDEALALLDRGELAGPAVTLDGDVVHPEGVIFAGGARAGLIRRRAEARVLAAELEKQVAEVKSLEEARAARSAEEEQASVRLNALRHEVFDRSRDLADRRSEMVTLEKRLDVLRREQELLETEDSAARAELEKLAERASRLVDLIAGIEELQRRLAVEIDDLRAKSAAASAARDEARRLAGELQVKRAEAAGRRDAADASAKSFAKQAEAARGAASQQKSRIAELEQKHRAALAAVEERRAKLSGFERAYEAAETEAAEADVARQAAVAAAREAASHRATAQEELRVADARVTQLTIERNRIASDEESIVSRYRDELGIDLREAGSALPRDPNATADTLATEVAELRRRLENMGGVNPDAIHELKEKEERFTYLKNQEQDLVTTKAQLEELIRKINRESRELLIATLEQTKVNFNEMFRKLFGGGKAEIVTEEGVDILESGIDLMAKPPGKEPATISQLSGGEKTLTVLAFIMALFQLKPSPFCILDEVDGPLDEANVDRYSSLIRDFSSNTQFIVITHNKKTMTHVDSMYGVTMEEKGISKKISINVVEKEREREPEVVESGSVGLVAGSTTVSG